MICPNCGKKMIEADYEEEFIDDNLKLYTEYQCDNCNTKVEKIDYYSCHYYGSEIQEVD